MPLISLWITDPPPSVNHSTAVFNGRKIKSKEARDWMATAALELMSQRAKMPGPCYWRADILIPAGKTKSDLGNLEKLITDALVQAGKVPDDSYLVDQRKRFHGGEKVEIVVKSEPTEYWGAIKGASKKLRRKLSTYDSDQMGMEI